VIVAICGPIASGKSTVARAVARLFEERGVTAAAIDLDLVYEMLEHPSAVKADPATWRRARIAAAAMTDALLDDGVGVVVVEGDLLTEEERTEFTTALRSPVAPVFVTLHAPVDVALRRVEEDPTRGLSRDPAFLRHHYEELDDAVRTRPSTDLVIDTSSVCVDEAARTIAVWVSN
jgi:chloramphenicol 3-O-phosphotransferase